jgi:hypothetical protein
MPDDQSDLARLLDLISEISERAYCAGWHRGIEFRLWHALNGGPTGLPNDITLTQAEMTELSELSDRLDAWVIHGRVPRLAPLPRWRTMFARYRAGEPVGEILAPYEGDDESVAGTPIA